MADRTYTTILLEYENLLRFGATSGNETSEILNAIKIDMSNQYHDEIEVKVSRWAEVTGYRMFFKSKPVEYYMQAKMLYRDGYYEAAIMMARSICEMICYDLLFYVEHPFGSQKDVEKVNFRKLAKHLFRTNVIGKDTLDCLNNMYDLGINYVHPKTAQNPTEDSKSILRDLGNTLFLIYGVKPDSDLKSGMKIETAYSSFPDIAKCYHYPIDVFATPEEALEANQYSVRDKKAQNRTNLQGAVYDGNTKWPDGFDPDSAGAKKSKN
ncbi:MAG: hypothetical protein H6670_00025 [Anaerolineaceae bacterium]|nr:hypothetical protein [Anaerolineaceae bacterium]